MDGVAASQGGATRAPTTPLAGVQVDRALQLIYATNADVSRAEALAYRSGCGCVFALLVRATPAVLVTLSAQVEVRAVDPEPDIDAPADAVFAPPLPEQLDRVVPPADESLSSPGLTVSGTGDVSVRATLHSTGSWAAWPLVGSLCVAGLSESYVGGRRVRGQRYGRTGTAWKG